MVWNWFKKNDDDDEKKESNQLGEKIEVALRKAQDDKRKAADEIKKIDGWARDAIIDVYSDFFENAHLSYYKDKHKLTALEKYEDIKSQHGSKLSAEMVEKCDTIVKGYLDQIELRNSKMKLFEKLEQQYLKSKMKLKGMKTADGKVGDLQSHTDRLKQLDEEAGNLGGMMSDSYNLEEINKEFDHKTEYFNQLEKLQYQFGEDVSTNSAKLFKDEVDKMINDIED